MRKRDGNLHAAHACGAQGGCRMIVPDAQESEGRLPQCTFVI